MAGWKPAKGCCEAFRFADERNEKQLFNQEEKWQ